MLFKLFIIVLFNAVICFSQSNITDILYPLSDTVLDFSVFPAYNRTELQTLQNNIEIPGRLHNNSCEFVKSDFLDSVNAGHFIKIDLNGDGQPDIVFSKHGCADELFNFIWIKQTNQYKYIESHFGTILRAIKTKTSGYQLLTKYGYCCGGRVGFYKLTDPMDTNKFKYLKSQQNVYCEFIDTQFPKELVAPRSFITITDRSQLRTSPGVNNVVDSSISRYEQIAVYGNLVAEYVIKSTGKILSSFTDNNGNLWYFVLMDGKNLIGYNRFYDAQYAYKCGWMNSKDIKILLN